MQEDHSVLQWKSKMVHMREDQLNLKVKLLGFREPLKNQIIQLN